MRGNHDHRSARWTQRVVFVFNDHTTSVCETCLGLSVLKSHFPRQYAYRQISSHARLKKSLDGKLKIIELLMTAELVALYINLHARTRHRQILYFSNYYYVNLFKIHRRLKSFVLELYNFIKKTKLIQHKCFFRLLTQISAIPFCRLLIVCRFRNHGAKSVLKTNIERKQIGR